MEVEGNWIFFLSPTRSLPSYYVAMDAQFKRAGLSLIPVTLSDLLTILKTEHKPQVICVVSNFTQMHFMLKKGVKVLNMLIRNDLIDLYVLSSFISLDQTATLRGRKNYLFLSLPLPLRLTCVKITAAIIKKWEGRKIWPGGKSYRRPKILDESF